MKKTRVGIVGCGNIFPMHAISIKMNPNLELVCVCDNKIERAIKAASKYECDYYTDYQTMIDEANIDVIHICTPHYLHAQMTAIAANNHIHVLTEKPMAINKEDAQMMIDICDKNKVYLGVIFQNRYNRGSHFLKEQLTLGNLGKILGAKCQVTWNRSDDYYSKSDWKGTWDKEGGGAVIDQAIHTLDLMRWFIDSDIEFIDAHIANRAHVKIDVEDSAEGLIRFKNGVDANFHVINYYTKDSPVTIELHCEKATIKYTDGITEVFHDDGTKETVGPDPNEKISFGDVKQYWGVSHAKQINQYYDALINHKPLDIDGREAFVTQSIVNGIYESGKSGKKIYFSSSK